MAVGRDLRVLLGQSKLMVQVVNDSRASQANKTMFDDISLIEERLNRVLEIIKCGDYWDCGNKVLAQT